MSRVFGATALGGVAQYMRIARRDGVTLGFTSHDRDLCFSGVLHRAAPGMVPSSIRLTSALHGDSADISGALSHDSISKADLAAGRFDRAGVELGVVDWETGEAAALFHGSLGRIARDGAGFAASIASAKDALDIDPAPRTSPGCRARFCGPGCNLSPELYESEAVLAAADPESGAVHFTAPVDGTAHIGGFARILSGEHTGARCPVRSVAGDALVLADLPDPPPAPGTRVRLRQGCDHRLATCAGRFANAANFQGEPHLPGNDRLTRATPVR